MRADEHGLPIHGALAAAEDWEVVDAGADGDAAWLTAALDYGRRDDRLAVFPFPHRLELELRLAGDALTVITTTVERDRRPTRSRSRSAGIRGSPCRACRARSGSSTLPARTEIALDERNLPTGERADGRRERAPLGDRVLDDHFAVAEDARFAIAGGGREIAVEWAGGYRYAQVFAPAALDVACLEPMMAPSRALSTGEDLELAAARASGRARRSACASPRGRPGRVR